MKAVALFYQNPAGFIAAVLLLVFSVIGFIFNTETGFVFLGTFLLVLLIDVLYAALSLKATRKYVVQVNKSLAGKKTSAVDTFPLPCVICDSHGNFVWYNSNFSENIIANVSKTLRITDFIPDYKYSKYSEESFTCAEFGSKKYSVFITKIKSVSNPMLCFYFFDDTYYKETEDEYKLSRPFVMHILVDNIEQLSRQLSDSKFALVTSGIESRIEKWLKSENVITKITGSGSFLVIGEKRCLDKLCEDKFSVLTEIRNYKQGTTSVNATLSIGVGTGENFKDCEIWARKALDMSLGRGGDQAAVYTENGYTYFGGVSNRANDNSKVSPRQTAANVATLIKKYDKVLIVGHKYSDYDAIGSAMGLQFFSEANGIPAFVVCDDATTLAGALTSFARSEGFEEFVGIEKAVELCDDKTLLFVVDSHRKALLECPELYDNAGAKIVIDHHRRADDYIDNSDLFYHSPSSSSACEMVAELIEYSTMQEKVPSVISTALLSGIVLDTKDYVLRTSQRTFSAAAFLRENNADTIAVKKLFATNSEMITLKNEIINSAVTFGDCIISKTDRLDSNLRVVTAKAADEMLNISGVKASFVLSYIGKNYVQISARSLGEENVQLIMELLGGGGHSTMAATQLKDTDLDGAYHKLICAIEKYFSSK